MKKLILQADFLLLYEKGKGVQRSVGGSLEFTSLLVNSKTV